MFIKDVVKALQKHRVEYALVGGYAVALHGAVRGTVDIDFLVSLKQKSFEAAEAALLEIGLAPRLPVSAKEVYAFREEYIKNRNLTAWSFSNPDNPLEIVNILITEDVRKIDTVVKQAFGMKFNVASIPDLVRMKRKSGRPQDLEDIKALEKLA